MKDIYRLCYDSGHTSTYCNGDQHIRLHGDTFGHAPIAPYGKINAFIAEIYPCDCDYWQEKDREMSR